MKRLIGFISKEYQETTMGSIIILIIAILLFVCYFTIPPIINKFLIHGGKQLITKPVYTDTQQSLGTYQDLNGSTETFHYQYAISFWIFLDSAPPNTNSSYNKYTSLLNFGDKPNVLYNGSTNTLLITINQKEISKNILKDLSKDLPKNKLIDFDENENRILYKKNDVLLQKWNNIIINYNGGTLDIFLNGELVKSSEGVVPYYSLDNLMIGENNGIKGGIANVTYFPKALNYSGIYYLYNTNTPDTTNDL